MHGNDVDIEELLTLTPGADPWGSTGVAQGREAGWIYGGQFLGQAVVAASRTVVGKRPHSLHAYFLRAGRFDTLVDYRVRAAHDGRSFATRNVEASQGAGATVFQASVSFHAEEPGAAHQVGAPSGVPDPESLDSSFESFYRSGLETSFDIRRIPEAALSNPTTAQRGVWLRATTSVPDDELFHYAALAYLSDFELLMSALERHAFHRRSDVAATSIDHALWWHAPVRVDDWLLFVRESPRAGASRGFSRGQFFSRERTLLASVAQEGLMRLAR